ncbi:hypothetical protein JCM11491_002018 [Sporobolomyces phaffii]
MLRKYSRLPSFPFGGLVSLLSLLSFLPSVLLAQTLERKTLAQSLVPDPTSTDWSSVTGEQVQLRPYSLALVANSTHVRATFNVSQAYTDVGWIALGLGTQMGDAAMVILWPTVDSRSWVVSHRTAGGHAQPILGALSAPARWQLVPALTTLDSDPTSTVVTIVRSLVLPKDQRNSRTKYANLARKKGQKLIFAASQNRRPPSDDEGAPMTMHDAGMFGIFEVDLGKRWIESETVSSLGGMTSDAMTQAEQGSGWTAWSKYDKLIAVHATFAMLTWLLVAPAAVLVARLGRRWGSWFTWHSRIQLFATLPLSFVTVSLGLAAAVSTGTVSQLDLHKTFGIVLFLVVLFQLSLGQLSHLAHHAPSSSRQGSTRPFVRAFHIVVGVATVAIAYATVYLGIDEWYERSPHGGSNALGIVYAAPTKSSSLARRGKHESGISLFAVPYVSSLVYLGVQRVREGRSVYHSWFGLGQPGASSPRLSSTRASRDWSRGLPPTTRFTRGGAGQEGSYSNRASLIESGGGLGGGGGGGGAGGEFKKRRSLSGASDASVEIVIDDKK